MVAVSGHDGTGWVPPKSHSETVVRQAELLGEQWAANNEQGAEGPMTDLRQEPRRAGPAWLLLAVFLAEDVCEASPISGLPGDLQLDRCLHKVRRARVECYPLGVAASSYV